MNYSIPVLGEHIFSLNINTIASVDMMPEILSQSEKNNLIQGTYHTKERILVTKMELDPKDQDYIIVNGTISYPKKLDTAQKLKNRFYGSELEADNEVIRLAKLEMAKIQAVVDFLKYNESYLQDYVTSGKFE